MTTFRSRFPSEKTSSEEFDLRRRHTEQAFARHQLSSIADDIWRCAAPGTGIYAFYVSRVPGHWILTGDIGHLVVRRSHEIGWLRSAVRSSDYFFEKVPGERRRRTHGDILEWLDDDEFWDDEDESLRERFFDAWHDGYERWSATPFEDSPMVWNLEKLSWHEFGDDALPLGGFSDLAWEFLALEWFANHAPESLPPPSWVL